MLTIYDLHTLSIALKKGFLSREQTRSLLKLSPPKGKAFSSLVVAKGILSQQEWQKCCHQASQLPRWPENPNMLKREGHFLLRHFKKTGSLPPSTLQKAYRLFQKQISEGKVLHFYQAILQTGQIQSQSLKEILQIRSRQKMICPSCQTVYGIGPYQPWHKYPCVLCSSPLEVLSQNSQGTREGSSQPPEVISTQLLNQALGERETREVDFHHIQEKSESPHRIFGKYRIEKKLGEGGMGAVYQALDPGLNRKVALKVITGGRNSEEAQKRFKREASLAAKLRHPGIVPLYEFGIEAEMPFFTMGFVQGQDLRHFVEEKKRLSPTEAISLAEKICQAVCYAHRQGVIHRDIKPDNIMIDREGKPLLMDFGLAKEVEGEKTRLTQSGAIVGSPEFMAPEQAYGEKDINYAADIYALGGILFYMLAGEPPFSGGEVMELLYRVVHSEPPRLRNLNPRVSREVERVVQKCLAKDPKHRYHSAAALLADLGALQRGDPISARPPSMIIQGKRWARKNPLFLVGLALFLVALFSISLGIYLGQSRSKESSSDNNQTSSGNSTSPHNPSEKDSSPKIDLAREVKTIMKRVKELSYPLGPSTVQDFVAQLHSHPPRETLGHLLDYIRGHPPQVIQVAWKAIIPWVEHMDLERRKKEARALHRELESFPFVKKPRLGLLYLEAWKKLDGKANHDRKKIRFRASEELVKAFQKGYSQVQNPNQRLGFSQALRLAKLASQYKDTGMPHYCRGQVYLKVGNEKKAISAFEEAAKRNPYFPIVYYLLSKLHLEQQNYKEALRFINFGLACQPQNYRFLAHRVNILLTIRDFVGVTLDLEWAIQNYPRAKSSLIKIRKGIMKNYGDQYRQAWSTFLHMRKKFKDLIQSKEMPQIIQGLRFAQKNVHLARYATSRVASNLGKGSREFQIALEQTFLAAGEYSLPYLISSFSSQAPLERKIAALKTVLKLKMTARPLLEYIYNIKEKKSKEVQRLVLVCNIRLRMLKKRRKSVLLSALDKKELFLRKTVLSEISRLNRKGEHHPRVAQKALGDKVSEIRREGAELLGKMGKEAKLALDDLKKALKDPDSQVQNAARQAIERISQN